MDYGMSIFEFNALPRELQLEIANNLSIDEINDIYMYVELPHTCRCR